jgi:predicted dehydrogenase
MIIYSNGNSSEYLDYSPLDQDGEYINIDTVLNAGAVTGLYFERARSIRLVWNYIKDIGLRNTLIKVLSRFKERDRNSKFFLLGKGATQGGGRVVFLAPKHPAIPSRVWLPTELFQYISEKEENSSFIEILENESSAIAELKKKYSGWDPLSGEQLVEPDWDQIESVIQNAKIRERIKKKTTSISVTSGSSGTKAMASYGATLFGYGNYAKTIILPSLPVGIRVNRIHEVDPTQISGKNDVLWSTSPYIAREDDNRIFFIAGYHHTHNGLACEALMRGATVVVEKPLVVTYKQLLELEKTCKEGDGKYFACFHKRYSMFNGFSLRDLQAEAYQAPINYHCIVYEVPLPEKHWYNWSSSSTRIISNGCHWIDHFLYLNDFSEPEEIHCNEAFDGTVAVFMQLKNKACFTMALTDIGSEKIGVQDHIELRRSEVTVKIVNGSKYIAESKDRVLRRASVNKISSYRNMYSSIGKAILNGEAGDGWQHNYVSSKTVLAVNEILENKRVCE